MEKVGLNNLLRDGPGYIKILLCFAAGALSALSMAPLNAWYALLAGLSAFYVLLSYNQTKRGAFLSGWAFGFGYFLFSLSWIGNALLVEGNPYKWAWPLAVCGLPVVLSLYWGFAALLSWRIKSLRSFSGYVVFVISLGLFEWLRGHLFTGFPWNLFGYSWADHLPMIQITALGTVYLLTLLTIFWLSAPGFLMVSKAPLARKSLIALIIIFTAAGNYAYGHWRLGTYKPAFDKKTNILVVQPNIAQAQKWKREKLNAHFETLLQLSKPIGENSSEQVTYIVWPETALNSSISNRPDFQQRIRKTLNDYQGPAYILSGIMYYDPAENRYYNALVMIDKEGNILNTYNKHHLVPFGEYIPFQKFIPLAPIVQFSGFVPGPGLETIKTPENHNYSPLICYETIFPGQVVQNKKRAIFIPDKELANNLDFMVNVTNDAWYGNSGGPYQHFVNAQFRAVEENTTFIRSANTGISGIIDPTGRVLYKTGLFVRNAAHFKLPVSH